MRTRQKEGQEGVVCYLSIPEVGSYVIGTVAELDREDFMHFSAWVTFWIDGGLNADSNLKSRRAGRVYYLRPLNSAMVIVPLLFMVI